MFINYPKRVVCLTEETTETLYLLGAQDLIVGISGFTVRPPQARKEKPKVSAFTSAKIPKILALEPDLVLGFSDLQADIAAELVRHGIETHVFNHRTVGEILRMIATLGGMLGLQAAAEELAVSLNDRVESIRQKQIGKVRPKVY
ncbi:MAG: ABC transporter substrate-binding protein, partial [Pseudomonadota bacterium]